jgi:GNAT superfamily N-acetyltransferase
MNPSTLAPADCSEDRIDAFLKLVEKGGEVISNSLKERIKNAKLLAFCHDGEQLVGVGALKNPTERYKEQIFRKAGHPNKAVNYKYEFGYLYVEEAYRRRGVGKRIFAALQQQIEMKEVLRP